MQCGMFSLFLSFFKNYFLVVIKHLESVNFVFLQNWEVFSPFLLYTYIYVKYYIYISPPQLPSGIPKSNQWDSSCIFQQIQLCLRYQWPVEILCGAFGWHCMSIITQNFRFYWTAAVLLCRYYSFEENENKTKPQTYLLLLGFSRNWTFKQESPSSLGTWETYWEMYVIYLWTVQLGMPMEWHKWISLEQNRKP